MSAGPVVLCVGEPIVALTPPRGTLLETAPDLLVSVGGAEVNVAIALARLGTASRFVGRVGDDPFGRRVCAVLVAAGVDTGHVEVDPEAPTGLYLKDPHHPAAKVHYYRRGSAATGLRRVPPAALVGVDHVHLTGITPALSAHCAALVESLFSRGQGTVSFDVNFRPALWSAAVAGPALLRLAARAHTLFVGLDEAATLWGARTPEDVRVLLPGVPELVVKDGGAPAAAFTTHGRVDVPAPVVDVVEPIGAGDAFAAGYLAARRAAATPAAALRSGHLLAAAVLGVRGDHGSAPGPALRAMALSGEGWPHVVG